MILYWQVSEYTIYNKKIFSLLVTNDLRQHYVTENQKKIMTVIKVKPTVIKLKVKIVRDDQKYDDITAERNTQHII